jgi:hypothetical protein
MDIIDAVLEGTKEFESPVRYYYWSTLAATSAVLKDHVWLDRSEHHKLYPNIYVLLYGPTGIRKSPPIDLAEELVYRVDNTRLIDGRSSIEAVIKELGTMMTRPGKPPIKDSCAFMVAPELGASIIGNPDAMTVMTRFYDREYMERPWEYRLKNSESSKLVKPTITWLSASNEELFRDFMPEKNLHGGLLGRMFVITEQRKNTTNSLLFKTVSPDKEKIANRLAELSKMTGPFIIEEDVKKELDRWYHAFDKKCHIYGDSTGFVPRVLTFILKISMILAVARRGDNEIAMDDIVEATDCIMGLIRPTQSIANSVKKDDATQRRKRFLLINLLVNKPEYKEERSKILQSLGLQIDHDDLDKVVEYLIQADALTIDRFGGKTVYRLRPDRPNVKTWIEQFKD